MDLHSQEKSWVQEDLAAAFQFLNEIYSKHGVRLFSKACSDRIRGSGFRLKEVILDARNNYFTTSMVRDWNWLLKEGVDAPSLQLFLHP